MNAVAATEQLFSDLGGQFVTPASELAEKLQSVRAVVFDWDGVFNNGVKTGSGSSTFSEVDSMGTNLLRFGLWLHHGEQMPVAAVITGVTNTLADHLVGREHFQACYSQAKHKVEVLAHLLERYHLQPSDVAFFFDDALDLSVAEVVGVRVLIHRRANPLLTSYVIQNRLTDYVTAHSSGQWAVREGCELLLGLLGQFEPVMAERLRYRPVYDRYYAQRQTIESSYWIVGPTGPVSKTPQP